MDPATTQTRSLEELTSMGEQIYFQHRAELESHNFGEYVVIEVDSREYFVNSDKLEAIQEAQAKYPNKLVYIVQVGNLKNPSLSEVSEVKKYGWAF